MIVYVYKIIIIHHHNRFQLAINYLSIYLSIYSLKPILKYVPGHKVQAEEADQIIRECKPLPDEDSRFDESIARIYFGQYLAMLVDESLV